MVQRSGGQVSTHRVLLTLEVLLQTLDLEDAAGEKDVSHTKPLIAKGPTVVVEAGQDILFPLKAPQAALARPTDKGTPQAGLQAFTGPCAGGNGGHYYMEGARGSASRREAHEDTVEGRDTTHEGQTALRKATLPQVVVGGGGHVEGNGLSLQ